jgi:hypothetical protein
MITPPQQASSRDNAIVKKAVKDSFSWVYAFIIKVSRIYKKKSLSSLKLQVEV